MIKLLHLSDIHLGSGFSHGKTNPTTGLNTRFEDFVKALQQCIDRAIAEPVDLLLFGGDAFPDATPAPRVQEAFAQQFHRLSAAGIPAVLLVGNHDQHAQGQGGASLSIYRTLGVPGMVVGDRLTTHRIQTAGGVVQVVTLPWLTRSTLLTRPETDGLSMGEVSHLLMARLRVALEGEIRQLNPEQPAVLLAHVMVDTAEYGAERFLAVGKGFTVPMALLAQPCFDYVALGHVHRHQVLCESPPVVYAGSIERVDFSEEKEDKGFVRVDLAPGDSTATFCPLPVRPFRTVEANLCDAKDPMAALLAAIQSADLEEAVVRLRYRLRPDQLDAIDNAVVQAQLAQAHTHTVHPELVSQMATPRLPELGDSHRLSPLEALKLYLDHRSDLQTASDDLQRAAQRLLEGEAGEQIQGDRVKEGRSEAGLPLATNPPSQQLRLL
ncbi:MAG: exonuclease subunit SbcD [Cyanobacteria bacterium P01_A01_bin.135]